MRLRFILFTILCSLPGVLLAKPVIAVSILPAKYFVERIAGDSVEVIAVVGEGYNPVTYEPKPKQLSQLKHAVVFFSVGVPYEKKWVRVVKNNNPGIKLVSLTQQIKFRQFSSLTEAGHSGNDHDHHNGLDPHFWLDPLLVRTAANTIQETLAEVLPENKNRYQNNYQIFAASLEELDRGIRQQLATTQHKNFAVFHPSWGYFADAYGLTQIAIQVQNRQSGARTLHATISAIRNHNIKVIFVQKQFSEADAVMVARETGARIVQVNPLAENYMENMQKVSLLFAEALK